MANNKIICHHANFPRYILGAASDYLNPIINNLIHYFKYQNLHKLSSVLSGILFEYLKRLNFNFSNFILIPILLHKSRERQRGYNQSQLLAEKLSLKLNIPLINKGLIRIKNTDSQARTKGAEDRKKNIIDCFAVYDQNQIAGKNILIIDDVFTSGATMNEAVKLLRKACAKKIVALVIAKA